MANVEKFAPLLVAPFSLRLNNILAVIFFGLLFSYFLAVARTVGAGGIVWLSLSIYVSFMFFFGYLFVIVDYTARGFQRIPLLSANILLDEKSRLFKEVVLIGFFASLIFFIEAEFWKVSFVIACLILFPIATVIIIMEESLVSAINPWKWLRVLMDLEFDKHLGQFLLMQLVTLFSGYMALGINLGLFNLVTMIVLLMAMLTLFRSLGVVLHSNAESLGFPVQFGERIARSQQDEAREKLLSEFSTSLYKLCNLGKARQAFEELETYLQADNYACEGELFSRMSKWESPVLAIKAGQKYIERLCDQGQFHNLWAVLEFCCTANNGDYRLLSSNTILKLIERAETHQQKKLVAAVLNHFESDFPNHPRTTEMLLTRIRFIAEDGDSFDRARTLLAELKVQNPDVLAHEHFQQLARALDVEQTT